MSGSDERPAGAPLALSGEVESHENPTDALAGGLAGDRDAWTLAAVAASDGLWYYDVPRQRIHLSPRAIELLGYRDRETVASTDELRRHVDARDLPALERLAAEVMRGDRSRGEMELRLLTVDGRTRWTQLRLRARRDSSNAPLVLAGSLTDVDLRKRAEITLREDSRRDPLTGLPNRTLLGERLTARIARAAQTPDAGFAVLYIDLDRFKVINDSLGHAAGDQLLIEAATRMSNALAPDDLLARIGGDEFVVLIDQVAGEDCARKLADALHASMRSAVSVGGKQVFTCLSIGTRMGGEPGLKPSVLLRDADMAMYHAKRVGGARTVFFDQRMHREMVESLRVQTELHHALLHDEFRVAYQPILDVAEQRLHGFEALVRWQHPTRGRLSASEFVGEANESGLIVQIGRWVLNEVCAQLAELRTAHPNACPLSVTVNLCDREAADPDFASSVEAALAAHGVPAHCLVLEMTEGAMTRNSDLAIPALRRLRELGVRIQMDGFGRGSTSLSVLRRMPLSAIKIDRSFIAGVDTDEESRAIVATIASFARALGLDVMAEGVETREQAVALAAIAEFKYVQGNHFGEVAETMS